MVDINDLIVNIVDIVRYGAGVGVVLALAEWMTRFFISMVTDRFTTKIR